LRAQLLVEERHASGEVRFFLDGAGLTYLRIDGGFLALLCEAEEWVLLPAGTRHWFDAGDAPQLDLLRLFSRPVDGVQPLRNERPQALPLFDEFVGTMLELTGHEAD
jgi:1,2-dihydroxy-3-keto-5-methylthiopentene dioxygenase